MPEHWANIYKSTADVYQWSYRYLRELYDPKTVMRKDRKACLRIWRDTNPAAYAAAFQSFWENRADIKVRRLIKEAYCEAQRAKPPKKYEPTTPVPPYSESHIYSWLVKKGLIK